jgi:hypothetical protein
MKRIIFPALVGLLVAACSSTDEPTPVNKTNTDGGSYMAVNIVASTSSRAEGDATFANGDADEYAVIDATKSIFYFYDAAGQPFKVDGEKNYVTGTGVKALGETNNNGNNITTSKLLLVLKSQTSTETPAQVVAVINAAYTEATDGGVSFKDLEGKVTEAYSLEVTYQVEEETTNEETKEVTKTTKDVKAQNFMMSNVVYYDGTSKVYATPISAENFGATADAAETNPVSINVERVAGKVTVAEGTFSDEGLKVNYGGIKYADGTEIGEEYVALVKGWTLFDKTTQTEVIKSLDVSVDGTWWYDTTNKRTYWANPAAKVAESSEKLSWESMQATTTGAEYPFENIDQNNPTSAVFAVQIGKYVDVKDESAGAAADATKKEFKGIDIARWLSKYYTIADLKTQIATYLKSSLFTKDGDALKPIQADQLDFVKSTTSSYRVHVALTDAAKKLTWVDYQGNAADVDKVIAAVPEAQIWKDGKCYYYTSIIHSPKPVDDNGAYTPAIIRNHWYQLSISSITGLGTPVFDPTDPVDPTRPDDTEQEWYLDAQINVLAWRIVTQSVDLK